MSVSARWLRLGLLALLAAAIFINIVQFRRIDQSLSDASKAIHRFETPDIIVLGLRSKDIRNTLNLYGALLEIAPDVTLIVPTGRRLSPSFTSRVVGLSRAKLVEREDLPALDPRNFAGSIRAQGRVWRDAKDVRRKKPGESWAIAAGSCPIKEMIMLTNDEFDYFLLDSSLAFSSPCEPR
ncbi:MAG: hypothetical protein AB7V40_01335 [Methyloceanibacter sp.]